MSWEDPPAAAIVDLSLPGVEGTAQLLDEHDIPIIVVSGRTDIEEWCERLVVQVCMKKPPPLLDLIEAVGRYVERES